jgi:hypothetical protein
VRSAGANAIVAVLVGLSLSTLLRTRTHGIGTEIPVRHMRCTEGESGMPVDNFWLHLQVALMRRRVEWGEAGLAKVPSP